MSMAVRYWWGRSTRFLHPGLALALMVGALWPALLTAQATDAAAIANQHNASAALAATIDALGGPAWLSLRTSREHVRIASFFQGKPTGEVAEAVIIREDPDKERIELDKGKVVQIFSGSSGWEITYKGKESLPPEKVADLRRWRRHTLHVVLDRWIGDPSTVVLDEGSEQVERHAAKKIMLINAAHGAVTLDVDAESHLPLRISYEWRDPRFHDKNLDAIEFDNFHRVDGITMPFTVTRTHNGEIVQQKFVLRAEYNVALPENLFDADYAASHLK
jgi:hypothetical protein